MQPWYRDRRLLWILFLGTILRVLPLALWPQDQCVRDECTYIKLSEKIMNGEGIMPSAGWLWAPGYPYILGIHKTLTGFASTVKGIQLVFALASAVLVYELARRTFESRERSGHIAAGLYMASLHMVFFAGRVFSEVIYGTLLLGGLLLLEKAREEADQRRELRPGIGWAAMVGLLMGCCVLFRGVATYMLPIVMFALLWGRFRMRRAWMQVLAVGFAAALTVAPYSIYATLKFDAFVVSDRTLGQMMYLGNNRFDPISFDYGNGLLSRRAFDRERLRGRLPCDSKRNAMGRDECQTEEGFQWIKDNPGEFLRRMPLRVAQMLTPHSLMTRHLRWGRWQGLPWWVDELLVVGGALGSVFVMWVGSAGLVIKGRGSRGVVMAGILLYHVAAISALAGLSRYRVPLEPLLMVYAAGLMAERQQILAQLRAERWRVAMLVLVLGGLIPLVLWFLPAGWPEWRHW